MSMFDTLRTMLTGYASDTTPSGDAGAHFDEVAQSVPASTLAGGIAAAMRSDQTPPFAQLVSQLFASGSDSQKMAMLNTLLSSASPDQRAQLSSLIPGLGAGTSVTADEAAEMSPNAVQTVAEHVEQRHPGIVDTMSNLYASHPALVKTLGTAAMVIAMRTIARRQQGA